MAEELMFLYSNSSIMILSALLGILILLGVLVFGQRKHSKNDQTTTIVKEEIIARKEVRVAGKKKQKVQEKKKEVKSQYVHPWLVATLKGHTGTILDLDFSVNGKYLATTADDRVILLWCMKNVNQKDHKSYRANVDYDHANCVKWSPDNKALIVSTGLGNTVGVYRVGKRDDGSPGNVEHLLTFPEQHKAEILNIGIACNGHFIMSISGDTTLCVWNLKGEVLATLDTRQMTNHYGCVSPCGRFVASSGFTPDVKVWEVCFTKTGEFKEVKRAFELKGHTSGVFCFAFSNDSTRMVSVSRDGTWKLWDCNIEYQKGQEPYLLTTGEFVDMTPSCIALSPDGRTVAIATHTDVHVFCGRTGKRNILFEQVHTDPVSTLQFSPNGRYLVASAGKHVHVFNNVAGFENAIDDLEDKKRKANSQSIRDRLQLQIDEARATLKTLQETAS
ncbi:transducin beta-like protein 2 isoform X2 [Ornithodoros turicata]|uniref:transducin beta-like protein 2 isoform X2 n=1 Tax=Ornithodoros turicata TaxID=34597 RepID=UPI00313A0350